jgi:hypothetical protein
MLKDHADLFEENLKGIKKRIEELESDTRSSETKE